MREVKHAEEEGVEFLWQAAPEAFLGDGAVERRCARCGCGSARPTRPAGSGRSRSRTRASALEADLVIKALGFDPEDLPALFDEPELAGHPLGHACGSTGRP